MSAASLKWPRQMLPRDHILRAYVSGISQMDGLGKVADAAIAMACERGDVIPAEKVRELCAKEYAAGYATVAPPVAAGSVDTEEFRNLLEYWVNSETEAYKASELGNLISHINAWGAQQRRAGEQHAADIMFDAMDGLRKRAEKAEARVKELESTSTARMGKSLLRPAISADNPLSPGCYCEPGKCAAPKIMGRQTPCRDPEKSSGIKK